MADLKISQLPAATTPLAGTEVLPIVQSGTTKPVSVNNLIPANSDPTFNSVTVTTTAKAATFDTNIAAAKVTVAGTTLAASGTDTNIDINVTPKGTGALNMSDTILRRSMFKDTGYTYYDSTTVSAIDFTNGSVQRWAPSGTVTLTVTNWPPTGNLGELFIQGINLGAATITWPTINWITATGATTTTFSSNGVTLQSSGTDWFLLWTRDGGTTIYGKFVR
jgi:archaellum component FlaF (FlaF/FlaG flagellin family)